MLRGTELILFVRAQNQASYTLRRVAQDVRALTHARDLQARAEQLAIRQASLAVRQSKAAAKAATLLPGGSARLKFQEQQNKIIQRRVGLESDLQALQRKRFDLSTQMLNQEKILSQRTRAVAQMRSVGGPRLAEANKALAVTRRNIESIEMRTEEWQRAVKQAQGRLNSLDSSQARLNARFREAVRATRDQRKELRLLGRQAAQTALEQEKVRQAMRLQGAERLGAVGRSVAHVGRIAQFGGLIGTAAMGGAAASAASFDTLVTQAATQARDLDAPLSQIGKRTDEIRQHILKMMQEFPAASDELAASAYDIFSSINLVDRATGKIDVPRGFKLMDAAAKVAVAGNEDLATSTNALITVVNNFDPSGKNLNKTLNTMFDIIRFGRMRLGDFNEMMNKVAPAAKQANQSLEDVGGAMAVLTEQIPSQTQVATGLTRLLQMFSHPDFIKGMEALGAPITIGQGAERRLKPLQDIINTIAERFPELRKGGVEAANFFRTITRAGREARTGKPGEGIMGTIYAQRAFTGLFRNLDEFNQRQRQIRQNQSEFTKAFQAQIETQGVRWKIFTNQVKAIVLIVGQEAIPVFSQLGEWLGKAINWWKSLSKETQGHLVRLAAWVAVGSLVGGVLLSVGGGLLSLIATLKVFYVTSSAAEAGMSGMALWGGRLVTILGRLGTLGAIAIALKVLWTGDATARDFLLGAIFGAAAGYSIGGPLGAVVGAITVPIILDVIAKVRKPGPREMSGAQEAYNDLRDKVFKQGGTIPGFEDFKRNWTKQVQDIGLPFDLVKDQTKAQWTANAQAAYQAGRITQRQYLAGMAAVGFDNAAVQNQLQAFNKAQSEIADKIQMRGMGQAKKPLTFMERIRKAAKDANDSVLQSELDKWNKYFDTLTKGAGNAAQEQRDLADAVRQAREAATSDIDQAASRLTQTYQSMRQANTQAFGELFQGPWLQSDFGQTAEQWDIKPRIQDLTKDLQMQLNNFNRFNSGLSAIADRGAPAELVKQLKEMGPDALDKIEVLRKAAPGQFAKFVQTWKVSQNAIEKATKIDFDKQLHQWFRYGKGIAQQIIFGLRSEEVALDDAFRKYVTAKFPNYIDEAVKKARTEQRARTAPTTTRPTTATKPNVTVHHEEKTQVNIHPQPGENTGDLLRKAAHTLKNGARTRKRPFIPGVTDYPTR